MRREKLYILKGNDRANRPVAVWSEKGRKHEGPLAFSNLKFARAFALRVKADERGYTPEPATIDQIRELQAKHGWSWLWTVTQNPDGGFTCRGITLAEERIEPE